jgi:DNA-binding response OmpR family regulator
LVDDEPAVLRTLELVFRMKHFAPVTAECGGVALRLAQAHAIELALIDINMPDMNGYEVCRALHEQARSDGRALRVWMMSGGYSADAIARANEAGAMGLMQKPFKFDTLLKNLGLAAKSSGRLPN